MSFNERLSRMLNAKLELNLDRKFNRKKAMLFLLLIFVLQLAVGYYIIDRWFIPHNRNMYDNKIDRLSRNTAQINVGAKTELALTYYLKGELSKAEALLRDILKQEPQQEKAALYLGLILSEQKHWKESSLLLEGYLSKHQGEETRLGFLKLGDAYFGLENYNLALKYYKTAAGRDPGNPIVYYSLGRTYEKLQDKANALYAYQEALKIAGDYQEAAQAIKNLGKLEPVKGGGPNYRQ